MKKTLLLIAVLAFGAFTTDVFAFEPGELIQWGQEQRLKVELSQRFIPLNDQPVHLGLPRGSISALTQFDMKVQYRLFENPDLGKFECYVAPSFLTHWDVYDRLNMVFECGYTFLEKVRIEAGHLGMLNIGRQNPDRGASFYWLGASLKLLEKADLFLDGYMRYYIDSNAPAKIMHRLEIGADPLTGEIGLRSIWKFYRYASLFVAPYVLFDDSLQPARLGTYSGLKYEAGKQFKYVPDNVSFEVGGNYGINAKGLTKGEKMLWLKLVIELR